jgi:PAS domain S-box-containing protein
VTIGVDESRALRDARALARLSIAVARASTATDVARILLDELTAAMPGASAGVALLDEAEREFELVGVRRTGEHATTFRDRWPFDVASAAHDVVVSGAPVSLSRDEYLARYRERTSIADPETLARYVSIPIMPGMRPIGAAGLSWPQEPNLDAATMAHLQALVDAGAQALGRARLEDAERRTRYLLRAIVDQIPLGLLIMEPDGSRPLYMNQAYNEIFGLQGETEPPADRMADVLDEAGNMIPREERPVIRATLEGETVRDQLIILAPSGGSRRSVLVNAWPVRDGENRLVAGVATHVDITSQIEADHARDAFLGVLSHELRTPITSIYAGAELLARRITDDEATRELAAGVADEANRLHRLVENLLVLSRVERGADLHRDDPVLLHHLARRVLAYEAERWPSVRFELEMPPTLPAVLGDDAYAEQILRNLLSNAAKYGPSGGVIRLVLDHEGDMVTIRVLDSGPGFTPGSEERVFELFYRAPSAIRTAPGAGIGLYAVKALAAAMNGRVWAKTRPEGGAEVGVELPVVEAV